MERAHSHHPEVATRPVGPFLLARPAARGRVLCKKRCSLQPTSEPATGWYLSMHAACVAMAEYAESVSSLYELYKPQERVSIQRWTRVGATLYGLLSRLFFRCATQSANEPFDLGPLSAGANVQEADWPP